MKKRHLIAALATLLFHAVIVVVLLATFLRYNSADEPAREWPPVDSAELLFGGDIVQLGDFGTDLSPAPANDAVAADDAPAQQAAEMVAETPAPTPKTVTSAQPSPAKEKPSPDNAAELKRQQQAAAAKAKAEAEKKQAEAIAGRMSFGGTGTGSAGQPDGTVDNGATAGVSASGLGNRKALNLPKPPKGPIGKVIIQITVNRQGAVTAAKYVGGEGAAASSQACRDNCVAAARQARFESMASASDAAIGSLTYTFK